MSTKAVAKGEHLLSLMTDFPNKFIYYPLAHLLYFPVAHTPVTPTQITIAHILCAIAGTVFLIRGEPGDILITFVLFQVRAIFDCLDGTLARRKNMSSEIGRIIDNLGDAIGFLCLMSGFTVYFLRSGRFTGLEIFALIFLTVLVSGIMAQGTDFYRRKFSYALREDRDIISEEISRKHHVLRAGGGSPLLWWGYANDWFQILVFAPASLRHLRQHIRSSQKPEEYRYDVEKIRTNTDSPRLKLAMFITAMMSGDNAVFVITLGLLTDKPEYGLYANLAYGVCMLAIAAITMNYFFHRKAEPARISCIALLLAIFLPAELASQATATPSKPSGAKLHFFSGLWDNVADTVWGSPTNIAAWFTVAGSTSIIVNTDLDRNINNAVGRSPVWSRPVDVGFLQVGNFVAAVPHTVLFVHGYFWGTHEAAAAGAAGLQALGINGGIVLFWKWAAGRPRPVYDARLDDTPRDKEFNFNIAEQSVTSDRWRWPSGHTSSMFAMAASFHGFYPDKLWLHLITYPLATIMGFAMINGQYHWTSDVTAGAIIGTVSGYTVGRNFRRMYNKSQGDVTTSADKKKLEWYVMPRQQEGGMGLAVSAVF